MRLSTAMMLGDSLRRRDDGRYLSRDNSCGCASGGAVLAAGGCFRDLADKGVYEVFKDFWPWFGISQSCDITLKFSFVCQGSMTFEQLVDYVRSIEPDCDCCRFNCDCAKAEQAVAVMEAKHAAH